MIIAHACTMITVHARTMIIVHGRTMIIVHANSMNIVHACTMIIVCAWTMIIVHACAMIIVHACTMIIVHACTMIIVHACTMILGYACTCSMSWMAHVRRNEGRGVWWAEPFGKGGRFGGPPGLPMSDVAITLPSFLHVHPLSSLPSPPLSSFPPVQEVTYRGPLEYNVSSARQLAGTSSARFHVHFSIVASTPRGPADYMRVVEHQSVVSATDGGVLEARLRPSDRSIEPPSDRAIERPSNGAIENDHNASSRRPFGTPACAFFTILQN